MNRSCPRTRLPREGRGGSRNAVFLGAPCCPGVFSPEPPSAPPPGGPCWPPAPLQPAELAPGPGPAPFPSSVRRWMEAETQGQGRGARRPGAPLCTKGRPSSTRCPLPGRWARAWSSDLPRRAFQDTQKPRQGPPPRNRRAEGRASLPVRRSWVLGAPGESTRSPLPSPAQVGPTDTRSAPDPGEARLAGASEFPRAFCVCPGQTALSRMGFLWSPLPHPDCQEREPAFLEGNSWG